MTTDNRTNESYEKLIRHLVTGLRVDAGDYAYVARGTSMSHELSWDARNQRAWDAATALEAMLDDRAALEAAARAAQGAAPQAPGLKYAADTLRQNASEIREAHLSAHGMVDPITNAVAAGIEQGATIVEELDRHQVPAPTPVLPSSTVDEDARSLSAWPTVDEVRERFEKSADRIAFGRMITEVERAAAEKALTEMANELSLMDDGGKRGLAGHSKSSASAITHRHAVAVVRARAEAYRREGKE